jgi:hypothetical protein
MGFQLKAIKLIKLMVLKLGEKHGITLINLQIHVHGHIYRAGS